VARHSKKIQRLFLNEVVTSLPGLHRPTREPPPDDLAPGEFLEVSTGEDSPSALATFAHVFLGFVVWIVWIVWSAYLWFFSDAPYDDLYIAGAIWAATFILTIMGVPAMRRKARNRVRS
jgi:hypothetical protein